MAQPSHESKMRWLEANREKAQDSKNNWARNNKEYYRRKRLEYATRNKKEAIEAYGGQCVGCGIEDYDLLCFDHVNDDGAERRKNCNTEKAGGAALAAKLRREHWPDYIQLLCFNCNHLKKLGRLWIENS